jgi:hypothetical protein
MQVKRHNEQAIFFGFPDVSKALLFGIGSICPQVDSRSSSIFPERAVFQRSLRLTFERHSNFAGASAGGGDGDFAGRPFLMLLNFSPHSISTGEFGEGLGEHVPVPIRHHHQSSWSASEAILIAGDLRIINPAARTMEMRLRSGGDPEQTPPLSHF